MLPTNWLLAHFTTLLYFVSTLLRLFIVLALPIPHKYAESHWRYHTFERYYTCSGSKLRHKAHQKVWKCSLIFPLKNGIVTSYENCTNKYVRVDKLGVWWYPPLWVPWHIRYNFVMAWAIITISLNVRKWTPNSYLKRQNFISDAKSVISKKP